MSIRSMLVTSTEANSFTARYAIAFDTPGKGKFQLFWKKMLKPKKSRKISPKKNPWRKKKRRKVMVQNLAAAIAYSLRNDILLEMGFQDYYVYLKSRLWKGIREAVLALSSDCFGCGRPECRQVHHGQYDRQTLAGEDLSHLYPICGRCHLQIEFQEGRKTSPEEATKLLIRMNERMKAAIREGYYVAPKDRRKRKKSGFVLKFH